MDAVKQMQSAVNRSFANERGEMVAWTLFDSLATVASTTQTLKFFQQSIATGENRTNMQSAGQLPKPKSFLATELGVKVVNLDGTPFFMDGNATPSIYPLNAIFAKMTGQINVDPSDAFNFHAMNYYNQLDVINDGAATSIGVAGVRSGPADIRIPLKIPIILGSNRAFNVTLKVTTPAEARGYTAANSYIYVFLKGFLKRNQ